MKGVSPIGKEWYEQVAAFESWAVGKTAEEVKAGIGEDGYPVDADLKAGCTIHASGFAAVVEKAIASATDCGAKATDTLKLSVATEKYYESNETNLQYDSNYAAVTLDADGKITSCLVDASQAKCSIADGKFTVEKGASPIGKEWYEQAAHLEAWTVGKTAEEVKAGIGSDFGPADDDLKAGCTITVGSILNNVANAATV